MVSSEWKCERELPIQRTTYIVEKWTTNIVQEKQDNRYQPLQPENESWRALISKLRPVAK